MRNLPSHPPSAANCGWPLPGFCFCARSQSVKGQITSTAAATLGKNVHPPCPGVSLNSTPLPQAVEVLATFAEIFQAREEWEACARWCGRAITLARCGGGGLAVASPSSAPAVAAPGSAEAAASSLAAAAGGGGKASEERDAAALLLSSLLTLRGS